MKLGFGLGFSNTTGSAAAFTPLDLEPLALYNVQDLGTLWQDEAGTVPADTAGQTVKRIDDLSGNGNHATNATGVTLRQDAFGFWYLETTDKAVALRVTISALAAWPTVASAQYSAAGNASYGLSASGGNSKTIATRQHNGIGAHFENGLVTYVMNQDVQAGHVAIVVDPLSSSVTYNGISVPWVDPGAVTTLDRIIVGATDEGNPVSQTSHFYAGCIVTRALTSPERSDLTGWLEARCPVARIRAAAVFSTIGQSNMAGRGVDTGAIDYPATAWEWTDDEGCIPADHPLHHQDVASHPGTMGLQAGFAAQWAAAGRGDLIFIASAKGGTGFSDGNWGVGDPLYQSALDEAGHYFAMYGEPLTAFLWHQGEADLAAPGTYEADLHAMIAGLRDDCAAASNVSGSETPFILGEITTEYGGSPNVPVINAIINGVPASLPRCAVASEDGLTVFDLVHFDEASLITLGGRYYDAFVPFG